MITVRCLSVYIICDQRSCYSALSVVLFGSHGCELQSLGRTQPRVACGEIRGHYMEELSIPWLLCYCLHSTCLLLSLVITLKLLSDIALPPRKTVNHFFLPWPIGNMKQTDCVVLTLCDRKGSILQSDIIKPSALHLSLSLSFTLKSKSN